MAKKNYREGGASLVAQVEELLRTPYTMTDGSTSAAQARWQAQELVWSRGCDIEIPPTPASDRIAALREAKDFRTLNREYMLHGSNFEAAQEQRNLARWHGMRRWASEPSAGEGQAETLARAQAEQREVEIEARAQAILADQNRAALDRARVQARKELTDEPR